MNKYYCSDGSAVSEATISKRRSEAYREFYGGEAHPCCEETGLPAQGSSHIVSQKRCKELHKTELIWNPRNFFPATHEVNSRWESNDSTLKNYDKYMEIMKEFDPLGYEKRLNLKK
jgi:hypothetical protein